jgi:ABC-2 type transport system permease protein
MVIANTVKSTFTYRAHVFFQILTSAFAIVIQYFLWSAVYGAVAGGVASGTIRGMTFGQTFLYVSLATSIGVLMRTWTDWDMNGQIRSGDIIMFFFKPIDYMRFMFANSMGAMVGNLITITVPSLVIIFGVFRAGIMLGPNIPFFVLTVAGSCVLSFLFDFIIGTTCFWTMSVWGISAAKDLLILFLSGALIPLQFYPDALLGVIRYLPFAYMYNLPLTILTAGSVDIVSWAAGFGIQCAWIVAMWFVVRSYFGFSMRKLTVNGG